MAAERLDSPPASADAIEPVRSRALERARALRERLAAEQLTPGLAETLRTSFAALATEPSREGADLLCDVMANPRLATYKAKDGVSLRSHAAEALLRMGYPFALEIPPEAMAGAVQERRRNEGRGRMLGLGGFLVLGAAALDALAALFLYGTGTAVGILAVCAALFALVAADHHPVATWTAGGILFLAGLAQLLVAILIGFPLLAIPGFAMSIGAALPLVAGKKTPPPPVTPGELLEKEDAVRDR